MSSDAAANTTAAPVKTEAATSPAPAAEAAPAPAAEQSSNKDETKSESANAQSSTGPSPSTSLYVGELDPTVTEAMLYESEFGLRACVSGREQRSLIPRFARDSLLDDRPGRQHPCLP